MLNVFPVEIHGTIPVAYPGLIYGAMLLRTLFFRLLLVLYGMILWILVGTLFGMLIGMLIGKLIGMLITVQNSTNF